MQGKRIWIRIASGGILSSSKEPPRASFDKLRMLASADQSTENGYMLTQMRLPQCSMARGATLTGLTPAPVTAKSASDEAVSTVASGDCFVGRKRRSLLAETGQMDVISSEVKRHPQFI